MSKCGLCGVDMVTVTYETEPQEEWPHDMDCGGDCYRCIRDFEDDGDIEDDEVIIDKIKQALSVRFDVTFGYRPQAENDLNLWLRIADNMEIIV